MFYETQFYISENFNRIKEMAELGYALVQLKLAYCYRYGYGTDKNLTKTF